MIKWLIQMKYQILTFRDYGRVLNRCATVEQYLLDCSHGRKPLPDNEKCWKLSRQLGVYDE